ncbi:MAG: redoxin family protein [Planctomycetota bacterium]
MSPRAAGPRPATYTPRMLARAPFLGTLLVQAMAVAQAHPDAPVALGARVEDLSFLDIRAQRRRLSDFGSPTALVLFFVSKDCPMVGRILPEVARLHRAYAPRGVQFLAVDVGAGDTVRDMGTQVLEFEQPYPFALDADFRFLQALGIERTTTAVVLDGERRLRYRGRVDDRVRYSKARDSSTRADLALALDAVLAGGDVEVPETPVEGCLVRVPTTPPATNRYTFHRDVEPIVQRHCQDCHHRGGAGPFPLLDYDDVRDHGEMIGEVVARQLMPPWHASDAHGDFRNRRGLGVDERSVLDDWLRSGMAKGDVADAPPTRTFDDGPWRIGTPDLVLELPGSVRLPADGVVPYKYLVFPLVVQAETWVEAVEILPSNRRVLHHANLAYFELKKGYSPDGFITGFVPGGDPLVLDPGTAMRIPAGSVLGLQAHYVTTGKKESDRIRVGLRFPKTRVTRRAEVLVVTNTRFAIPPGAPAHRVAGARKVVADSTVIGMFAHMHLRGRDMTFVAHRPNAEPDTLLMIPNYDFDWQSSYRCHDGAVRLPAGTRVEVIAHFDNSRLNPFNPDASATVRFGQQTFEEMMYGFVFCTRDDERLDLNVDPTSGHIAGG